MTPCPASAGEIVSLDGARTTIGTFGGSLADLVSVDLLVGDQDRRVVEGTTFLCSVEIPAGFAFEGTVIGGLSGIIYDLTDGT